MIRLKDIAQRAGVSVMTVSKVLRDAPDISKGTKTLISALAQEMGYVPNPMAQGLRNRKTKLLGVVIPTITNPVYARILLAIEQRAFELEFEVILAHSLNQPDREEAAIRRLLSRRVDGLLVAPVYRLSPSAPVYEELQRNRVPLVILGQRAEFCQSFVNVESDDAQASYELTRHLVQLGHRRIAFLAGPLTAPWAQERLEGYRRALREIQIESDDGLVFRAGSTIEEGEKAVAQMLAERPQTTAIQAVNDMVAIGAANVLLNQGWKIPLDVSVVGFGNILTSEYYRVPLTTIHQPKFRIGSAAIEVLLKLMAGTQTEPRRLPAELVIRTSSGPARL